MLEEVRAMQTDQSYGTYPAEQDFTGVGETLLNLKNSYNFILSLSPSYLFSSGVSIFFFFFLKFVEKLLTDCLVPGILRGLLLLACHNAA